MSAPEGFGISGYARHSSDKQPGSLQENQLNREQERATTTIEKADFLLGGDASKEGETRISLPEKILSQADANSRGVRAIYEALETEAFNISTFKDDTVLQEYVGTYDFSEKAMVFALAKLICTRHDIRAKLNTVFSA